MEMSRTEQDAAACIGVQRQAALSQASLGYGENGRTKSVEAIGVRFILEVDRCPKQSGAHTRNIHVLCDVGVSYTSTYVKVEPADLELLAYIEVPRVDVGAVAQGKYIRLAGGQGSAGRRNKSACEDEWSLPAWTNEGIGQRDR